MSVVLDASAVLAFLGDEPGADVVQVSVVDSASISAVNLSEIVVKLSDRGMPLQEISEALAALHLQVEPFDEAAAYEAGALRRDTKSLGLSLGDRACLALARATDRRVLTADRSWNELADLLGVEVTQIR